MYCMNTFIDLKKDVQRIYDKCISCRKVKSKVLSYDLYTLLPIPNEPLVEISMDFFLGLPRLTKGRDSMMRSNHQRIHWRFQLIQLLGLGLISSKKLSMDFFKIHGLKWTSRGFVIIKSKPWLIWFMFKRGLLVEPKPLHKDWEKKTRFGQFDLLLLF